jgi:DNA-directed RNA polymerase specialized sigma24 family protein
LSVNIEADGMRPVFCVVPKGDRSVRRLAGWSGCWITLPACPDSLLETAKQTIEIANEIRACPESAKYKYPEDRMVPVRYEYVEGLSYPLIAKRLDEQGK